MSGGVRELRYIGAVNGATYQPSMFRPGFGMRPHTLAGRANEVESMRAGILSAPDDPRCISLILGKRGFGKTVVLSELEDVAASNGYLVLSEDATTSGLHERIIEKAHAATERGADWVSRHAPAAETTKSVERGLNIWGITVRSETSVVSPAWSLQRTLATLASAAAERGTGVLLTVDEMHAGDKNEIARLAADLQQVTARGEMPLAFVGAALPEILYTHLRDPRLSFFRRCEHFPIGRVPDVDARVFFYRGVRGGGGDIDNEALDSLVASADGYPYKMQLAGWWAWKIADAPLRTINASDAEQAARQASATVRERVHAHVWGSLSAAERALICAVAQHDEPVPLWEVSDALPGTAEAINEMLFRVTAVGGLGYMPGSKLVKLGDLMDAEFVRDITSATSAMDAWPDAQALPSALAAVSAETRSRRPRCNKPMKRVPGRCVLLGGHNGRCRSQ